MIDILQSDALDDDFSILGNTTVEYNDPISIVISDNQQRATCSSLGRVYLRMVYQANFISQHRCRLCFKSDNRYVKVFGNQLVENDFQFRVFNRWGLMVYETSSLEDMLTVGWDGRHKGDYLPSGAYPYILKAVTKAGEVIEKKGVISIIN